MNIFEVLINLGTMFSEFISTVWTWFTSPLQIGTLEFTPIDSLPIVGIALIVMWLIKTFVPLTWEVILC